MTARQTAFALARLCGLMVGVVLAASASSAVGAGRPGPSCAQPSEPRVALDARGDAVALWLCRGGKNAVQGAVRPTAPGVWTRPQNLARVDGGHVSDLALAFDSAGDAAAVWRRYSAGGSPSYSERSVVQAAVRPRLTATWSAPQNLSAADANVGLPQVALDSTGDAVAIWLTSCSTADEADCLGTVQAAARPAATGTWSAPEEITAPGQHVGAARVALDPAGDAVAVWKSASGFVQAVIRPGAARRWSLPQDVAVAGALNEPPQVALDAAGNAIVVYSNGGSLKALTRSAARGDWSAPQELPREGKLYPEFLQVALAANAAGDAVAVWRRGSEDAPPAVVQASVRTASAGRWGTPQTLSKANAEAGIPQVALDAAGDAVAVWQDGVRTSPFVCPTAHCTFRFPSVEAAVRLRSTGTWSAPHTWRHAGAPTIALDPAGDALTVMLGSAADQAGVLAIARPATTGFWGVSRYVSAPSLRCMVPNLIGLTLARAKTALRRNHCKTGRVTHAYSRSVESGHVVAQRPKPETRRTGGAPVELTISRGP